MSNFLLNSFNPLDFDPTQGGGSWPLGKHPVVIVGHEVKPTKDNQSGYLQFSLEIIDGPNKGHKGTYNLNLYNQSAKAAEIAHKQLSAVCHAVQVFQLGPNGNDLTPLYGRPFVVEVGYQRGEEPGPNNPEAKGYTEIKRIFDINGNEPKGAAQQQPNNGFQQQQQTQQQPQGGAQAWGGQTQQQAPQEQQQNGQGQGAGWGQQQNPQNNAQGGGAAGGGWGGQGQQQNGPQNGGQGAQGGGWSQQGNQQQTGGGSGGPSWGQR